MALSKTIGKARLKFDELYTVLVEVENTINSRPLTYLSDENFQTSLTPNHLIYGRDLRSRNDRNAKIDLQEDELRIRVKHLRFILDHFENRFYKEYIIALREKHNYYSQKTQNTCPLEENDVVLIHEPNLPRSRWRKGRINELIKGHDGKVRGVILKVVQPKTKKIGLIKRPLQLIVPLEIKDGNKRTDNSKQCEKPDVICERTANPYKNNDKRTKRMAAVNSDLIRRLTTQ